MADDSENDEVAFEVPTTVADQAAFLGYVTRRPRRLAIHAGMFAVLGLLFFLFEIVLGVVTALFTARHGLGDAVQRYFTSGIRQDLSGTWPVTLGVVGGLFALNLFILTPLQCRRMSTALLATYPESRNDQPTPTLVIRVRLDARGVELGTRNERVFMAWPLFARLAETSRYFYLMRSASTGLVLPKRALDTAGLERVRAICGRFVGTPEAS